MNILLKPELESLNSKGLNVRDSKISVVERIFIKNTEPIKISLDNLSPVDVYYIQSGVLRTFNF